MNSFIAYRVQQRVRTRSLLGEGGGSLGSPVGRGYMFLVVAVCSLKGQQREMVFWPKQSLLVWIESI
jgi:hypothetical protein